MSVSTSTDDPELARLVADMAVTQTPAPRHAGGVVRGAQTNGHGGTFLIDSSTVMGQPITVRLNLLVTHMVIVASELFS